MDDSRLGSIAQLQAVLKLSNTVEFKSTNTEEMYEWIGTTLGRFRYASRRKKERSIIKNYIITITGLSNPQVKRLIARKRKTGRVVRSATKRTTFPRLYTTSDIALLIETDNAHNRLSGPATKRIFERAYAVFGDERFKRIKDISVSHLYTLRGKRQYQSQALTYTKTTAVQVPIGERRKPNPQGRPGYLRVDTVHQGDLGKEKGVYHINIVDEVTQWEVIGAVEGISEQFLAPLLESLLEQFPFVVRGFHSDNGSEYINTVVARLLAKLLAQQTKSRSRHCNDNALVEGKNGSVIRTHMGRAHIPRRHAPLINEFYQQYFNEYLNFHRPCGFSTSKIDPRGKEKKVYDTYFTPYEKLRSLENPKQYLKPNVTLKCLDLIAQRQSDNESAALMRKKKVELFNSFSTQS
jgi:transposase InsO family protein